ncbi:hypothetical protein BJX70DRAFT_371712 [Aspergillus crustosus]
MWWLAGANMNSLRYAACRLLAAPAPALLHVRPSFTALPSNYPLVVPRRTFHKNSHVANQEKGPSHPETAATPSTTSATETTDSMTTSDSRWRGSQLDIDYWSLPDAAEKDMQGNKPRKGRTDSKRKGRNLTEPNQTIFVGNLFYDVTASDLKRQMSKYGVVQAVRVIYDTRGISKGFAYVQFDTIASAEAAINAMHLRVFEGRRVTVYYAMTSLFPDGKQVTPTDTLYVGNMPFNVTDRDIQDLVWPLQNVIDARVSMDRNTGHFLGFVHIQFLNVASAMVAAEMLSNPEFHGRKLRVAYSNTKKEASHHSIASQDT